MTADSRVVRGRRRGINKTKERTREKERLQDEFIRLRLAGLPIDEILLKIGRKRGAYERWRERDPDFERRNQEAWAVVKAQRAMRNRTQNDGLDDFAVFRKLWFGHDSPWFHLEVMNKIENATPGSVTLILLPPRHAKTTLIEDYICWKLVTDPNHRFVLGSETRVLGRKMVGRVKARMEPAGSAPGYAERFGPFEPQKGDTGYQPWGSEFFNVRDKSNSDERDYSVASIGMDGGIIGTRCDTLIADDVQSTLSLNQSEKMLGTFRQDWLSRPGTKGKTVVLGSRVGMEDFYHYLMESGIVDNLVLYPAQDPFGDWLWPQEYTADEYLLMRRNAGEPAWLRNYMMQPERAGDAAFDIEMLNRHEDPLRAVWSDAPEDTVELCVGLDPGFGVNAVTVAAFCPNRMVVLDGRTDTTLRNNQEIIGVVEEMFHRHPHRGAQRLLMIEDKAFQKGLMRDESLVRLRDRMGVLCFPHNTGSEKNDENVGVPSMAAGFLRGEIVLPGANDPDTQRFRDALNAELLRWRPRRPGTKLKQDMVMSLWFCWLLWRRRREYVTEGPSGWDTGTVPWNTPAPELIVPVGSGWGGIVR